MSVTVDVARPLSYGRRMHHTTQNTHNTAGEPYEAPTVTTIGDVDDLTQGNSSGGVLDESFPVGTPFSDLTFS